MKELKNAKCEGRCLIPENDENFRDDCPAKSGGMSCTLPKGHKGDHIACAKAVHDLHIWKRKRNE